MKRILLNGTKQILYDVRTTQVTLHPELIVDLRNMEVGDQINLAEAIYMDVIGEPKVFGWETITFNHLENWVPRKIICETQLKYGRRITVQRVTKRPFEVELFTRDNFIKY